MCWFYHPKYWFVVCFLAPMIDVLEWDALKLCKLSILKIHLCSLGACQGFEFNFLASDFLLRFVSRDVLHVLMPSMKGDYQGRHQCSKWETHYQVAWLQWWKHAMVFEIFKLFMHAFSIKVCMMGFLHEIEIRYFEP